MFSSSPSVCYQSRERGILKTNELIMTQIGASVPWSKGIKRSTSGVMRSKVKVAVGRS